MRRFSFTVCVMLLCACFSACGSKKDAAAQSGGTQDAVMSGEAPSSYFPEKDSEEADGTKPREETAETVYEPVYETFEILNDEVPGSCYFNLYKYFSGGRAWVYFKKDGKDAVGVIDEEGELIFHFSDFADEIEEVRGYTDDNDYLTDYYTICSSPFVDGMSCCYIRDGMKNGLLAGFFVVDADGTILFSSNDSDPDTSYYLLGYGDGIFLVVKEVKNFTQNGTYIYTVDQDGNIVQPEARLDIDIARYTHIGNHLFNTGDCIYNADTGEQFDLSFDSKYMHYSLLTGFYDGKAILAESYECRIIGYENLVSREAFEEYIASNTSVIERGTSLINSNLYYSTFGEGLFFRRDYFNEDITGFYDLDLNKVLEISLPDGVELLDVAAFSGGYAPVILKGADKNVYQSVIDRSGNFVYQPVKADVMNSKFYRPRVSFKGYCITGYDALDPYMITSDGNILSIWNDFPEIGSDAVLDYYFGRLIQNGFLRFPANKLYDPLYGQRDIYNPFYAFDKEKQDIYSAKLKIN